MTGRMNDVYRRARTKARVRLLLFLFILVAVFGSAALFFRQGSGGDGDGNSYTWYLHVTGHPTESRFPGGPPVPKWLTMGEYTAPSIREARQECEDAKGRLLARVKPLEPNMRAVCTDDPDPPA